MKNFLTVSLVLAVPLAVVVGCSDEPNPPPNAPNQADGGSHGGSAGAATTSTSSGGSGGSSSAGASGASGKAGGGAAGSSNDAGSEDVLGGDDGGDNDASTGADAAPDQITFDDGSFPANATIGSCDPLNWITSASSSAAGNPTTNAIDGLLGTRWSTGIAQGFGEYYEIDFGGYVQLSQIRLDNTGSPGDHPRGYDVQTSQDGVDFSNVIASGTLTDVAPPNNVVTIDFPPRAVRYLRVQLNASSGSWWSIHELALACLLPTPDGGFTTDQPSSVGLCGAALAGRPDGGPSDAAGAESAPVESGADTSLESGGGAAEAGADASEAGPGPAEGGADTGTAISPFDRSRWTATASSTSTNAGDAVGNAIDGNIATRWSSGQAQAGTEFFKIDLGSVGCVSQLLVVASGTDFAAAYTVAVSTDDVSYITVAKGTGSNVMEIHFLPRLARYVRINQVGTSTSWWSIDELTVLP